MVKREKSIYRVTIIGSIVNLLLMAFKFMAGVIGHSSAMIADAVHSLSDFVSDIIVVVMVRMAGKPQDADHDYGHGKYETLAAVIVGILLILAGAGILVSGIGKTVGFFRGEVLEEPNSWALCAAALSIMLKEALYRYTLIKGRALNSPALTANAWHHRSDALTSVAALAGIGGSMMLGAQGCVLDPLAAVIVSVFIIKAGWELMKQGIDELLEKSLPGEEKSRIGELIRTTPGVAGVTRLRTRRLGASVAVEAHVKMPGCITLEQAHEIATEAERRLRAVLGPATHVSLHMEPSE